MPVPGTSRSESVIHKTDFKNDFFGYQPFPVGQPEKLIRGKVFGDKSVSIVEF